MKYLKYLLYFILGLALIFFSMGVFNPSVSYESEVVVNKPIEEAWAVMSDESRITEWLKEIKRIEHVSGTPNTVGAVSKFYVEENGEEMVMEETITSFKHHHHIAMTFTMDFMNMDYEMFMTEKDGKTHIRTKSTTVGNGIFAKSILAFMPKAMKEQEEINLDNLKKVIEGNTKNYFSIPEFSPSERLVKYW
jgi:uncharacterized protein YndB with AHSA1/START domain